VNFDLLNGVLLIKYGVVVLEEIKTISEEKNIHYTL